MKSALLRSSNRPRPTDTTKMMNYDAGRIQLLAALLLFAVSAIWADSRPGNPRGFKSDILVEVFGYQQEDLAVPIDTVLQGCGARDCIPSIDEPTFLAVGQVDFLAHDDLVLVVEIADQIRAYPTRILDVHEIVNDRFGDLPVVVTYCPLCGSGLAFVSRIGGEEVAFGVSGLLHNSDLIMYDRSSNSLWQQISGEAIAGPRRGDLLEDIPLTMASWGEFSANRPDARVLAPPDAP